MMYSAATNQLPKAGRGCELEIPVKNTFVHFDVQQRGRGGTRLLQRNQTDPGAEGEQMAGFRLQTPEDREEVVGCTGGTDSPRTPSPSPAPSPHMFDTRDVPVDVVMDGAIQSWLAWHPQVVCSAASKGYWIPVPETGYETMPESRPPACAPVMRAKPVSQVAKSDNVPVRGITFVQGGLGVLYTFTLRLAPERGLGLDLHRVPVPDDRLIVKQVLSQGAVEAWNRQAVADGASSGKAVVPGDRIVRVNGSEDCDGILEECRKATQASDKAMLLKFFFVRGVADEAEIKEWLRRS